ncbi:MAG TPA: anaerobic ribonucleoside-triphosphate reductase [Candidatus Sumerlaeota bacterium]|nr:anaerobic ribonucleoside-triphosphate reductase [Candidatus Sumerlaeota bacterium]
MNQAFKNIPESERTHCEVWSRVMGYFRPVQSWNSGKKSEYRDRVSFVEPNQTHAERKQPVTVI